MKANEVALPRMMPDPVPSTRCQAVTNIGGHQHQCKNEHGDGHPHHESKHEPGVRWAKRK
jgi:hypothetical protein